MIHITTLIAALAPLAPADETLLLQEPTVSAEHIVFRYADDLWVVGHAGGEARRLTSSSGTESHAQLSPDGRWVAFTGEYQGNADVYVVPVDGGAPRRLTWHPGSDRVVDWHPDGGRILFRSARESGAPVSRLFLVGLDAAEHGGTPSAIEVPRAVHAAFDANAARIAYTPYADAFRSWKRYRGGRLAEIWIFDRESREVEVVPHVQANDTFPNWVDGAVYFASDRDGTMDLYRFRPGSDIVEQITTFTDFDVRNVDAGGGLVVFEQAGALHLHDPSSGATTKLSISVRADGLGELPRWQRVAGHVRAADVAPNGKRAVFEARGEIITVPREHGAPRNLTRSSGAHDRSPIWSPDGSHIAWLSDATGEYQLVVRKLDGGEQQAFDLNGGGFFYSPSWSPDGAHVLMRDKFNRLFFVTLETGAVTAVAENQGSLGVVGTSATWSPDSAWIAYERSDPETLFDSIALFEVATGTSTAVTDGFAAAWNPAFSPDGEYLYFSASVNVGPNLFGLDMSASASRPYDQRLYVAVLSKDGAHPLAPRSDEGWAPAQKDAADEGDESEGNPEGEGEGAEEAESAEPGVDLDGLGQRIVALPLGSAQYGNLVGTKGGLLYIERSRDGARGLKRYDLESREAKELRSGVSSFRVSGDGKTLLLGEGGGRWSLADTGAKERDSLAIGDVRVWVDPAEEWPQTLREVWRIQRDYFYDPNMHGVDWEAMWERHSPFLEHVRHRSDLSTLMAELIGELACGHQYVRGGEMPEDPDGPSVGLVGADWRVDSGRYRIARIYAGQNWNAGLRAPLTEPGVGAEVGDYLLAVDGREVAAADNLFQAFEDTAGRPTVLTLASAADGSDARDVQVVPIGSESSLRRMSWVEGNRRRVDERSGGRLAYVYMPNTGGAGQAAFDRDFYSQIDREGLVLDERFNGGGKVADYVIDVLSRDVQSYWMNREGWVGRSPFGMIDGPKVMVVNERAGSGGDWMPWAFKNAGLGPLVGRRTWGGLVGISGYPPLIDGGSVTAASFGVMDAAGNWAVENVGAIPDVEVVQWPKQVLAGEDPQLDRAVDLALDALDARPKPELPTYKPPTPR